MCYATFCCITSILFFIQNRPGWRTSSRNVCIKLLNFTAVVLVYNNIIEKNLPTWILCHQGTITFLKIVIVLSTKSTYFPSSHSTLVSFSGQYKSTVAVSHLVSFMGWSRSNFSRIFVQRICQCLVWESQLESQRGRKRWIYITLSPASLLSFNKTDHSSQLIIYIFTPW